MITYQITAPRNTEERLLLAARVAIEQKDKYKARRLALLLADRVRYHDVQNRVLTQFWFNRLCTYLGMSNRRS